MRRFRTAALLVAALSQGVAFLVTGSLLAAASAVGFIVAAVLAVASSVRDARRERLDEYCGFCGDEFDPELDDPDYCSSVCRELAMAEDAEES